MIQLSQLRKAPLENPNDTWVSTGVTTKPLACAACKFAPEGAGFCGDDNPAGKRMAIVCPAPTKGEILEQIPWRGGQGSWYSWQYLEECGIPRKEVMISHVLRCRPPWSGKGSSDSYPTGAVRRSAEFTCRSYDKSHTYRGDILPGGIKDFAPTMYFVAFAPEKGMEVTAYKRLIQEVVKKAWRFALAGEKPCVLMGEAAFALVGQGLVDEGGVKAWEGHYWRTTDGWAYDIAPEKKGFAAPTIRRGRSRRVG